MHDEAAFFSASALNKTNGSNNNVLTLFNSTIGEAGCNKCHGSIVKVKNGELSNWPNAGIGRINPDGSVGNCGSCHPEHKFSLEFARSPESCASCHLGPDHPQKEMFEGSKHGQIFAIHEDEYNLTKDPEEMGAEEMGAPTCYTCHMSGFGDNTSTHNVSARLYWELETKYSFPTSMIYEGGKKEFELSPAVVEKVNDRFGVPKQKIESIPTGAPNPFQIAKGNIPLVYDRLTGPNSWWQVGEQATRGEAFGGTATRTPTEKRKDMKEVCGQCHSESWVDNEFSLSDKIPPFYDAIFEATMEKYQKPLQNKLSSSVYNRTRADDLIFKQWHHEGRRMRMGQFMQSQDFVLWKGSYEMLENIDSLAEIEELVND